MSGTNVGTVFMDMVLNNKGFKNSISSNANMAQNMFGSAFKKIATAATAAFSIVKVVQFGKQCVKTASETESAWIGLQSIVEGQGRSFNAAQKFIEEYTKDGLIPLNNAVTAYKNLASRGYDDTQIQQTLTALKDAAAFGRQASYSYGEAIQSASEGLKNENSILVDNAGVTKNVAKMWDDYAKSVGKTSNQLTQQEKIQAEVNGILEESKFQAGDAAKYSNTYAGQVARLSASFTTLKQTIGSIIIPIAQVFIPWIQAAINAVLSFAKVIANVVQKLTGKSGFSGMSKDTSSVASGFDNIGSSATGAADAAKKAAKKVSGSLNSFDEINTLNLNKGSGSDSTDTAGSGASSVSIPTIDTTVAESSLTAFEQSIIERMKKLFAPISNSWAIYGQPVIDSAKNSFSALEQLGIAIGKSFEEVWTNGTGEQTVSIILQMLISMFNIIKNISTAFKNAWQNNGGTDIIQKLWNALNNVYTVVLDVQKTFEAWTASQSFQTFANSCIDIISTLSGWIEYLSTKFKEIWDNGGKEAFENLLQGFTAISTAVDETLVALTPLVEFIIDAVIVAVEGMIARSNGFITTLTGISNFITGVFTGDWSKAWEGIKQIFSGIWEFMFGFAKTIFENIKNAISNKITEIKENFVNKFNEILNKVDQVFPGMKDIILTAITAVKNTISNVLNGIKSVWNNIWNGLKNTVSNVWNGIWNVIKNIINSILGGVEKMVNGVVKGFNGMIQAVNKLKFDIPDWVPAIGGKSFGINLPQVSTVSLPRLYDGGWFKANQPTLAVVGDNKTQAEIVSPEDKIRKIVREENQNSSNGGKISGELVLVIKDESGYEKGRKIIKLINGVFQQDGYVSLEV